MSLSLKNGNTPFHQIPQFNIDEMLNTHRFDCQFCSIEWNEWQKNNKKEKRRKKN